MLNARHGGLPATAFLHPNVQSHGAGKKLNATISGKVSSFRIRSSSSLQADECIEVSTKQGFFSPVNIACRLQRHDGQNLTDRYMKVNNSNGNIHNQEKSWVDIDDGMSVGYTYMPDCP
jgi:hypothetical protein